MGEPLFRYVYSNSDGFLLIFDFCYCYNLLCFRILSKNQDRLESHFIIAYSTAFSCVHFSHNYHILPNIMNQLQIKHLPNITKALP